MGKLLDALKEISKTTPNELDVNDPTMIAALESLEANAEAMGKLKGTKQSKTDFETYIKPLLDCETESKKNPKSWRIVIDMALDGDTYSKEPMIQVCSGEPSYHRFIMKFNEKSVDTKVESECVVANPDLSVLQSKGTEHPQTLAEVKKFYDDAQIQRIAVLGSARVFAHPEFIDEKAPEKGQKPPDKTQQWGQGYTKRVETELNKFLDVMKNEGTEYLTVNGGWAGVKENSTGMPLISSLVGAISDAEHSYSLPPITVMPEVGAFDRVVTRSDAYTSFPSPKEATSIDIKPDIHTYFEVQGGWGDDSKYLVGLSTGLMVFEPYGFWTNIEIANGVAQDKPVAIIVDLENLKPGGKYYEQMKNDEPYAEIKIPLPEGKEGAYRIYKDAGEAAQWVHDQANKNLQEKAQTKNINISADYKQKLQATKAEGEELTQEEDIKPPKPGGGF